MIGVEKKPFFCQGNRYAAHRDIEIVGLKILHQLRPGGRDVLNLDAERVAQRLRHVDVEATKFRSRLIERRERQIVARHADAQRAAFDDVVEAGRGRRLLGVNGCRHQTCRRHSDYRSKHYRLLRRRFSMTACCDGFRPDGDAGLARRETS